VRSLEIKASAVKELEGLPEKIRLQIAPHIRGLRDNPYPSNSKKLKNSNGNYRLRSGSYRVIYSILPDKILIQAIGDRKDIYG